MKIISITCDGCPVDLLKITSHGVYVIKHENVGGAGMWGDNRMDKELHFCHDCFDKIYKNLPFRTYENR